MNFFLKNIVFNKHIKYKRYNIKFLNSIVNFALQKSFSEVLTVKKPILLDKKNNFDINKFRIKIYSQNNEDGIILYILKHIGVKTKKFIEIGIENGTECNTTNLLKNFDWTGLQIEGNKKLYNNAKIQLKKILGKKINNLKLLNCFVTKENVNKIIKKNLKTNVNFKEEIDLLSIDIDGNDFWVWESINCIQPRVVIIEYNSFFGSSASATIKYNPKFSWDHINNKAYYGASLQALEKLGKQKNYKLIGVDNNGVNAFFIRNDLANKTNIKSKKVKQIFVDNKREFRNTKQYLHEQKKLLKKLKNSEIEDLIKI